MNNAIATSHAQPCINASCRRPTPSGFCGDCVEQGMDRPWLNGGEDKTACPTCENMTYAGEICRHPHGSL